MPSRRRGKRRRRRRPNMKHTATGLRRHRRAEGIPSRESTVREYAYQVLPTLDFPLLFFSRQPRVPPVRVPPCLQAQDPRAALLSFLLVRCLVHPPRRLPIPQQGVEAEEGGRGTGCQQPRRGRGREAETKGKCELT